MARPTIYNETILEKAREYLSILPVDEVVHSIAGLACHLSISRDTVYAWAAETDEKGELTKPEFSDIAMQILQKQETTLVNKGLKGDFNATIAKLLLSKHGYKDSADVTSNGKEIPQTILVEFIDGKGKSN